jgi:hypothetical protein
MFVPLQTVAGRSRSLKKMPVNRFAFSKAQGFHRIGRWTRDEIIGRMPAKTKRGMP